MRPRVVGPKKHNAHKGGATATAMGLGSTTKKIQLLADSAEKMYHRLNEVREQVETTQRTVDDTGERVQRLESEIAEQRAILEAIAGELDIDLAAVTAEAHIIDAEDPPEESDADGEGDVDNENVTGGESNAASESDTNGKSNGGGESDSNSENDAADDHTTRDAGNDAN